MYQPKNILLDREWNNAQIYNLFLLELENKKHEARHRYKTTPSIIEKRNAYADFNSYLQEGVDFMVLTPRINYNELLEIKEELKKVSHPDFERLCRIDVEVKLLLRKALVMDFRGKRIKEDQVLSQAMR